MTEVHPSVLVSCKGEGPDRCAFALHEQAWLETASYPVEFLDHDPVATEPGKLFEDAVDGLGYAFGRGSCPDVAQTEVSVCAVAGMNVVAEAMSFSHRFEETT